MASKYYIDVEPQSRVVRNWYPALDVPPSSPTIMEIPADDFEKWHGQSVTFSAEGQFAEYTPPAPSLKTQAATALEQARSTVYANYGILNEPTPDPWVTYLKALMAIQNGTDTTSTALPTAPAQ